jgi:hypothetical protein
MQSTTAAHVIRDTARMQDDVADDCMCRTVGRSPPSRHFRLPRCCPGGLCGIADL